MKQVMPTLLLGLFCVSVRAAVADDAIVIYPAFTATNAAVIEGRVVERKRSGAPDSADGKRQNFRRISQLMVNDERKHYPVVIRFAQREWPVTTDNEGYFRAQVDGPADLAAGWHAVEARTERGHTEGRVLKVPRENTRGIISDVDDTILVTEVNSKRRMLGNTFFYNSRQRKVVPGIVDLYRTVASANPHAAGAPIVFLSASPRQLHTSIEDFLSHNAFPDGVLITKRVTDDRSSEPITDQVRYKIARIEAILGSLPHVRFTLIGDDGEYDPEIYSDIQRRFPARIAAIWIRRVNPDPTRARIAGQAALEDEIARLTLPKESKRENGP
jgi:phosphatidate phosphatase APP1